MLDYERSLMVTERIFSIPGSQIGARCGTPSELIPAEALRNPGSPDRVHCETPSDT